MQLVERHIIKKSHQFYKQIDALSFQSKNLYNSLHYIVKQNYINNKKYTSFKELYAAIKQNPIWNGCGLPKKVCNQIVKLVDKEYSSFYKALKSFKSNPNKFTGIPKPPRYKDSVKGRELLIYEKQALYKTIFKKTGKIKLSDTSIIINTQIKSFDDVDQVRIVPSSNYYVIDVIYTKPEDVPKSNDNIAAIDLGLNNLATVSFIDGKKPFIINGKPLKAINQYYNKTKSYYQSKLNKNKKSSNKIVKITNKRNRKIEDYLHKASKILVDQLVSRDVSRLIIGYNQNWKQDINIGKKNNQNFVSIPHHKFVSMLEYKCKLKGISTEKIEESYTSKCSFLDGEEMKHHEKYMGKRVKRGLFKSKTGKLINADLNGSYNIMRKVIPNFIEGIEAIAMWPKKIEILS
jgi:hypothetical protein